MIMGGPGLKKKNQFLKEMCGFHVPLYDHDFWAFHKECFLA